MTKEIEQTCKTHIKYTEKGEHLHTALAAAGLSLYELDGIWHTDDNVDAVQAFIDNYSPTVETLMTRVNSTFESLMMGLTSEYTEAEVNSWSKQESEARKGGGPMTEAIASARGISLFDLCNKILSKADSYAARSGTLIGTKQLLEECIKAGGASTDWPAS